MVIERFEFTEHGTFGRLITDGLQLFTGELPWRENRQLVSCIPPGDYYCPWTFSPRFERYTYLVSEVPGRGGIRFHAANFMGDETVGLRAELNGCISLGERLGFIDGQRALMLSAPATKRFEQHMGYDPFKLRILERK